MADVTTNCRYCGKIGLVPVELFNRYMAVCCSECKAKARRAGYSLPNLRNATRA